MRRLSTLLLAMVPVVLPSLARTQPRPATGVPVATVNGAFFALSVADLNASAKWYSEKLGLTIVTRGDGDKSGPIGGFVILEGGGLIVELLKHAAAAPRSSNGPDAVQGFFKAGAIVADFDRTVTMLRARGVEIVVGPFAARETARANVIFKDNAGNLIQLFGDYARK